MTSQESDSVQIRVTLYGTQGSGSIFPSKAERDALQELTNLHVLEQVFSQLQASTGAAGELQGRLEDLIGGPVERKTVLAYLRSLKLPSTRIYGGWTTCLRIETSDGYDIVLDCGSGFRNCAKDLQKKWDGRSERHLHIFGSHSHLDHTEGFDQAAVCFDPRNHLHIYGNRRFLRALDLNLGIFSRKVEENVMGVQTPIFFSLMPAHFRALEIRDMNAPPPQSADLDLPFELLALQDSIQLGKTTITPFQVFHPAPCLGYRVDHGGKRFVFCTDHELRRGSDPDDPKQIASLAAERRVCENSAGADLLYRDGQYLQAEYDGFKGVGDAGTVPRLDWGHSCIEDIQEMVRECDVKHTLIGHHDPNRDWSERNWIDESLARISAASGQKVELGQAETVIEL